MKILKKMSILLLSTSMIVGSIFVGNIKNSYADTAHKKQLKIGTTYKYDLDGDGDKDSIKAYVSGTKLILKVNNTTKTLDSTYDKYGYNDIKIYDFNKNDKSFEIVYYWIGTYSEKGTRILKFKNNECMINKHYKDAELQSYDPNTGMVTFEEYDEGRYNSFVNAMGQFYVYDKVRINGFNAYNQYTANTGNIVRENEYVAGKTLTAYASTSTSGVNKAFPINKGSKVYVYALYQNGSAKYIKMKTSSGKYGYVKVGTSMLFTHDSCLCWG